METLFNSIIEKIKEIAKEQNSFRPPIITEYNMEECDYESTDKMIYGKKYMIGDNNENIILTYEVKDKSKPYQSNPDLNIVTITWNKNTQKLKSFIETWENNV